MMILSTLQRGPQHGHGSESPSAPAPTTRCVSSTARSTPLCIDSKSRTGANQNGSSPRTSNALSTIASPAPAGSSSRRKSRNGTAWCKPSRRSPPPWRRDAATHDAALWRIAVTICPRSAARCCCWRPSPRRRVACPLGAHRAWTPWTRCATSDTIPPGLDIGPDR